MFNRLLKLWSELRGRRTEEHAVKDGQALFLHGNGEFGIDVTGVSQHQATLQELFLGNVRAGQSYGCVAGLILGEGQAYHKATVKVSIENRIVGQCPAYFAPKYREWLRKWHLLHSSVQCQAIIVVEQSRTEYGNYSFSVKLDIEQPFKMTIS